MTQSDKAVGYALLALGLAFIVVPGCVGLAIILKGAAAIPKILEAPVLSNGSADSNSTLISAANLNQIVAALWPSVNASLVAGLGVVLIYAGSVVMSRGVSLIKEINLKVVREAVKEASEEVEVKKETPAEPEKAEGQPEKPPPP